jgi:hypothetical protein
MLEIAGVHSLLVSWWAQSRRNYFLAFEQELLLRRAESEFGAGHCEFS